MYVKCSYVYVYQKIHTFIVVSYVIIVFYIVHFICFHKTQQDLRGVGHDSGMPEVTQSSSTVTTGSNREETCDSGNQQAVQSTSGEVSFLFFKEIGYT